MKIYTKKGDKGFTTLAGGTKVSKNHPYIEAYGTIDELISHIGLLHSLATIESDKEFLLWTEDRLMVCAALLASENEEVRKRIPEITGQDVARLEDTIDKMESKLPPLDGFILPGGSQFSAECHIARTVCRRAERNITAIARTGDIRENVLMFINRLSDCLFVMARKVLQDFGINDIKWNPK